mgnify:CR=1 FL=1
MTKKTHDRLTENYVIQQSPLDSMHPMGVLCVREVIFLDIREMRSCLGDTQAEFAQRYQIPFRTVQNWESGVRVPPEYMMHLLENRVKMDLVNRKTANLPIYDPKKQNLPRRNDYIGALAWLHAVTNQIQEPVVFALDEALMCQGNFGGRSDEFVVWVYGADSLSRFNGVAVLGNKINPINVQEKNGLRYTDFSRTLSDALANESILDMQGITEALSRYYYKNGNSFQGISPSPEYQDAFDRLADAAIDYYNN